MQRKAQDNDPFSIKKDENRYSNKERCKVLRSDIDYSNGERSPYADWTRGLGGFDPIDPDNLQAEHQPWARVEMSDAQQDSWDALLMLRPSLVGRQREIVDLLMEGETSQTEIAAKLGMKQPNIRVELTKIGKMIRAGVI